MRFKVVAVGGTLDIIHAGHAELLTKAFEVGEQVLFGLTTDDLVKRLGKKGIRGYAERKRQLTHYLKGHFPERKFKVVPLNHPLGLLPSDRSIEAVVLSEETFQKGVDANFERWKKGMKPLAIFAIPQVRAEDSAPISSTRIRNKEIDAQGRLLEKPRRGSRRATPVR